MRELKLFLNSGKCSWGKCIFCGWGKKAFPKRSLHELKKWVDDKLVKKVDRVKIFCSGSFLDDRQISPVFRRYLISKLEKLDVKTLIAETREEFIVPENLESMKSSKVKVVFGVGLEVANDNVLKKLKKGKTVKDYIHGCAAAKKYGFGVRSYILVNAPFSTCKDLDKTVKLAKKYSESVCLINCVPHSRAEIFNLWVSGKWKPLDIKQWNKWTGKYKDKKIEKFFYEFSFKPRFPMHEWIRGATVKTLKHRYFEVWQDYICRFYSVPKKKSVLVFVPCAFRKPYTKSRLHKAINSVLKEIPNNEKIHLVVVSTPGVVPIELCNNYPFNKYDWPEWEETPAMKREYLKVTQKRVENFLRAHGKHYKNMFVYLKPDTESGKAVKRALDRLKLRFVWCVGKGYESVKKEKNPLAREKSLSDLKKALGI